MTTDVENDESSRFPWIAILVCVLSLLGMILTGMLARQYASNAITLLALIFQTIVISIVIWQACEPFADAAQWIGNQLRLPGSVRGATLDAIASSMPELFSGVFFVVVAVSAAGDSREMIAEASGEGFGASVATCAGSAIYNMVLIPAICGLVISYCRRDRPTIDVDDKVISRDGLWFLGCEVVLIFFLFQNQLYWWTAIVLVALYAAYVYTHYSDTKMFRKQILMLREKMNSGLEVQQAVDALRSQGIRVSRDLVDRFGSKWEADSVPSNFAELAFGLKQIRLNAFSAWSIILVSTTIVIFACYWLVEVTNSTADHLHVPVFFIAVILAAAASSVPDTFLSVASAMRGDDDGAVSNAFGSNIFDISICLSVPLLVASWMNGWQPVELTYNGEPMPGLIGLRILLFALTIITLLVLWHNRQLTRTKAFVLCGLYLLFVCYAVLGSIGWIF
jgi:cation:H+ antiporter